MFMFVVYLKKYKYARFLEENKDVQEEEYGVPHQYGLFFAMGERSDGFIKDTWPNQKLSL